MKSIITTINAALRKAGLSQRFVRGRGYYYVTECSSSTGLYGGVGLDNANERDWAYVRNHVNEVLANERLGYQINAQNECVVVGPTITFKQRTALRIGAKWGGGNQVNTPLVTTAFAKGQPIATRDGKRGAWRYTNGAIIRDAAEIAKLNAAWKERE